MDENVSPLVYIASASQDEKLRKELENHLNLLVRKNLIRIWHRQLTPLNTDKQQIAEAKLSEASIILVLMSADLITEWYEEMEQAALRSSSATVIPILLRDVDFADTPFERLQCLPRSGPPIADCPSRDQAFREIVSEIRKVLPLQDTPQRKLNAEQKRKLEAMIADHRGFMQDRLNSFVGRQSELAEIQQRIHEQKQTGGYITIAGQAGQGKSSIIAKLIELSGQESKHIAFHFIPLTPGPDHQVGLLRNLMARLILKYDLSDIYIASDQRAALRDYFPKVLQDIAAQGQQEVIYIDGLDQLEEDLNGHRDLSFLPTNPPVGIVFVLGTRPDDTLRPLELLKPFAEYRLPNLRREDFDLILAHRNVQLEKGLADRFYQVMEQNALYLDLAAKELREAGHLAPDQLIAHLGDNPSNLFSLSIARFKRQPLEWREVLKPVFGVLLAAREPLSLLSIRSILQLEDERLRDGIQRLGGLLTDTGQHRYTLFHLKLRDYLKQNEQELHKEYVFATDEEEGWHAKLIAWCEGGLSSIWENPKDIREQERRLYVRKHLIAHCYYAKQWDRLFAILDEGSYGRAKERYDVSTRSYIEDLNYGCQAAAWERWDWEEALQHLPHLWRYTLLRCSLRSRSDNYPDALFHLMLLLGREQEVLGHAELLTNPVGKAKIFLMLAEHLSTHPERQAESKQFLLRMQEIGRSIKSGDQQVELVQILVQAKLWELAEEVVHSIPKGSVEAWALSGLVALARAQRWKQAESLWEEVEEVARSIPESFWQSQALKALAKSLGEAQRWEEAEGVARLILPESFWQAEALRALAKLLGEAQRWEEAEGVVRSISESSEQAGALAELAGALTQAQRWEEAELVWEEAERVARSIPDSRQQAGALRELVKSLGEAQRWEEAEGVVRSISESSEQAGPLAELAGALTQAQRWEEAELVWEEAEEVARSIPESWQQVVVLRELAGALTQAQRWKEAEEVARLIPEFFWQAEVLSELGIALIKKQHYKNIESLCNIAEGVARSIPESWQQVRVLRALARALAEAQRWEEAEGVARSIPESWQQAEALVELAKSLGEAQRWEEAEGVARSIPAIGWQAGALVELAKSLGEAQKWEEAEGVARSIPESRQQAEALIALVKLLGEVQRWEEAEGVARSIPAIGWQAGALVELAKLLGEAQRWEEAEGVARSIPESWQQAEALIALAKSLGEAQRWEEAELVWEEAEGVVRSIPESWQQAEALIALARALGEAQRWEEAEGVARSIPESRQQAEALKALARALGEAQRWEEAEGVARSIPESWQQAEALKALARALGEAQRWEEAEGVARSIIESYQQEALIALARALGEVQRWEEAEGVARSIPESWQQAEALKALARALGEAQRWEEAEEVARSIPNSLQQVEALSVLVKSLGEAQRWEPAEEVARSISAIESQEGALNNLIELFFRHKEYEQGLSFIQQRWLEVNTRSSALQVFSSAVTALVPLKPDLGMALYQEFQWVDAFLGGKTL